MQISVLPVSTLFKAFSISSLPLFSCTYFSARINSVWIQQAVSILTMSEVKGTSDLLQCGPGMCLADARIMPGFLQSRNNWITKHRSLSFVTTFLVSGKHPLISPWLLRKSESVGTVQQGRQEVEQLHIFLINTCGCDLVWLQKLNKSEVCLF